MVPRYSIIIFENKECIFAISPDGWDAEAADLPMFEVAGEKDQPASQVSLGQGNLADLATSPPGGGYVGGALPSFRALMKALYTIDNEGDMTGFVSCSSDAGETSGSMKRLRGQLRAQEEELEALRAGFAMFGGLPKGTASPTGTKQTRTFVASAPSSQGLGGNKENPLLINGTETRTRRRATRRRNFGFAKLLKGIADAWRSSRTTPEVVGVGGEKIDSVKASRFPLLGGAAPITTRDMTVPTSSGVSIPLKASVSDNCRCSRH